MRILLVVSVALIGLFADQNSLFADTVWRYQFDSWTDPMAPLGTPVSGYIDMTGVSGVDVPVLQAISNFVITSGLRPGGPGDRPGVDHWSPIPPITFSLADATFNSDATISWGPQADTLGRGNILSGWDWAFLSPILTYPEFDIDHDPDTFPATNYCLISSFRLATFWPVEGGANQSNVNGDWVFVGTAVPEAGGTLGYLALGLVLLSATQLRRKI